MQKHSLLCNWNCQKLARLRDSPQRLAPQTPDVKPVRDGEPLPLGGQQSPFKGGLEHEICVGRTVVPPERKSDFSFTGRFSLLH